MLAVGPLVGCPADGSLPPASGDEGEETPSPAPDDDDGSDATPPPDDDDDSSAATPPPPDDDDSPHPTPDDDDDDGTPPAPSTTLTITSPADGALLAGFATFAAWIDGEAPGMARWLLDGVEVHAEFFSLSTGATDWEPDTFQWPDGAHTLAVLAPAWGLQDSIGITLQNGDLALYPAAPLLFDPLAAWPGWTSVTLVDAAVSLQAQVWPDAASAVPAEALFGFLLTPSGQWATGDPATSLWPVYASWPYPWAGGVPNDPDVPWETGLWYLYPWAEDAAAGALLDSEILVKRWEGGDPEAGLLALDFHFADGSGLDAAEAAGDADFADFLDALEAVLLQAGIALGDVRYWDVPGSGWDEVDGDAELLDLFAQAPASGDRVLNVFVVADLDIPGGELLGIASHIPGPALQNGTPQGGVAVEAAYFLDGDEATAAALVGHEAGHYLGLYHPTEIGGPGVGEDPLGDTAACCDAGGCWETNLMDPYLWGSTAITADQAWVMLRHPLVQLVPSAALPSRDFAAPLPLPAPGPALPFCGTSYSSGGSGS